MDIYNSISNASFAWNLEIWFHIVFVRAFRTRNAGLTVSASEGYWWRKCILLIVLFWWELSECILSGSGPDMYLRSVQLWSCCSHNTPELRRDSWWQSQSHIVLLSVADICWLFEMVLIIHSIVIAKASSEVCAACSSAIYHRWWYLIHIVSVPDLSQSCALCWRIHAGLKSRYWIILEVRGDCPRFVYESFIMFLDGNWCSNQTVKIPRDMHPSRGEHQRLESACQYE